MIFVLWMSNNRNKHQYLTKKLNSDQEQGLRIICGNPIVFLNYTKYDYNKF